MEIYKRGQGVWARALAIIIFLFFAGWGVLIVHRLPAELNVIVRPNDVIWQNTVERLLRNDIRTLRVKGLANQPISQDLLKPGIEPAGRIDDKRGHAILLAKEEFTPEKLKELEDNEITRVPVLSNDQLLDTVNVDEWLLNRKLAQDVTTFEDIALPGKAGEPLDEALVGKIREILAPYPDAKVGPLFAKKEDFENRQNARFLGAAELQAGLIPGGPLHHRVDKTVGHKGTVISKEIYEEILALVSQDRIPDKKIRIEDVGNIGIDAGNVQALGRRYLVAKQQADVDTWWSAILFRVPLVNVDLTPGLLVSLGLFVAVTLAILYTWNLKKWSDLLIETQTEMRKVSWPKKNELIGSSMVVIVCVLILGIYLYVVDILLTTIADKTGLLR